MIYIVLSLDLIVALKVNNVFVLHLDWFTSANRLLDLQAVFFFETLNRGVSRALDR